ncbi:flagellar biosynthesis protein FlgA [candidate division KSB1 bacterium]|nr:MAG: flagellar biosynthesis protein FlgA [candidate division KSB1 bacterium]
MIKGISFKSLFIILIVLILTTSSTLGQSRIKDVTQILGLETKRVIGYGLVTGLNSTGDGMRALFTIQSVANLLKRMGLTINAQRIRMRNVAAVMVIAELPPFARRGQVVDAIVSSLGDATSLEGGTLLRTPLLDLNNKVIAYAQGVVSVGGLNTHAGGGRIPLSNFPVTGRVNKGCKIEQEQLFSFITNNSITLTLNDPDFTTAYRIAERINREFNENISTPIDAATVNVQIPQLYLENNQIVEFISKVERLPVITDVVAKVVINERTGTVVVGNDVRLSTVAISHGDLSIQIRPSPAVQQPPGAPATREGRVVVLDEERTGTVGDLAEALNVLGVKPRDLVSIFQALKAAGSLKAE